MGIETLVMLGAVVLLMVFMTRGSRKRQKQAATFRDSLAVGTQVMTASGMVGTITALEGDLVTLEGLDGSATRWVRAAISKTYETPEAAVAAAEAAPEAGAAETGFEVPDDVSTLINKINKKNDTDSQN